MSTEPHILIVEDDFDIRDTLSEILSAEGYRVSTAANGREALDQLGAPELPCVILLDLMMPVMNGWQFRAEQEKDPRLSSIPVIVISADAGVFQKADALRAAAILRKPVQLDDLLEKVRGFGGQSHPS